MTSRGWTLALAGVENFILINAALSLISFSLAALLRASNRFHSWHPSRRARVYAAALIIPPLASIWLVCAALLPAIWLGGVRWEQEHELRHAAHLLNAFTIPLDPALGYATLCFAALAAMVAAYAAIGAYFRIGRVIDRLEIGAQPADKGTVKIVAEACRKHGITVGLVASDYPFSFVWGYRHSKLVVSTGLLNTLSEDELAGVLEHEAAHHARRDNVTKLILTICRYISPAFPLTRLLYRWWSEQVEMICDEVAAHQTRSPVELAGALVRLKRVTLAASQTLRPAVSRLFGDGKENFEQRVERILSLAERTDLGSAGKLSRSCAGIAITLSVVFLFSLSALFMTSPLAIHTVLETILHLY